MKQTLFTLLLLCAIGFVACRKSGTQPNIKEYDQQQIQSYISANSITGMVRDTSGGDTTGIWYKIITPGTGAAVAYTDYVSYVYTVKSFDNLYISADTITNHSYVLLGHVVPNGLMLAIRNILKNKGGKMRVLIPSHLAYGTNGAGSGSKTVTNGHIAGNQCLDYTINLINAQSVYDDMVIQNYIKANSLTGYTKITSGADSGMYYKITTVGTGSAITINSTVTANDIGELMDNTIFENHSGTTTITFSDLGGESYIKGVTDGLMMMKGGGGISLLIPSSLAYGTSGSTGVVPTNACLRFDITNIAVTN